MAKYNLRIVLDRDDPTYAAGEKITGRVEVQVLEDCHCKRLIVSRRWTAQGERCQDSARVEGDLVLFSGPWQAGQSLSYPFEFPAPAGPLTYQGRLFSIGWRVAACAEVGLWNPDVETQFRLVAGEKPAAGLTGAERWLPAAPRGGTKPAGAARRGLAAVFSVGALAVGLPALLLGLQHILPAFLPIRLPLPVVYPLPIPHAIAAVMVGGLLTVAGWRGARAHLRSAIAGSKLGAIDVELSPPLVRPGDRVTCTVRFQPRAAVDLIEGTAKLVATEHSIIRGTGDESDTHRQQVVSKTSVPLGAEQTVSAGQTASLDTTLTVPQETPHSFWGGDNKLLWTVRAELKLRGWPDWSQEIPVTIRP